MKIGFGPIVSFGLMFLIICLAWTARSYVPDEKEAKIKNDYADALKAEGAHLRDAEKRRDNAKAEVNRLAAAWQQVVAAKTPPASLPNGINLAENAYQLTVDSAIYRNSIQKAVNAQIKKGGVKVINEPYVTQPTDDASQIVLTYYNYPAIPFPVVIFDLGQVTVQGTYPQICENMRAWKDMPNYLAVADRLTLTGTAPVLTGTYSVSMVGFIRGDKIYPVVNVAPQPNGAGGAGGGGGAAGGGQGLSRPGGGAGGSRGGGRPQAAGVSGGGPGTSKSN